MDRELLLGYETTATYLLDRRIGEDRQLPTTNLHLTSLGARNTWDQGLGEGGVDEGHNGATYPCVASLQVRLDAPARNTFVFRHGTLLSSERPTS